MDESLFEHQCRDQMAQRIRERTSIDPLWDSDQHGLLVQRLPSGELQVHVPTSVSRDRPSYIITPVAEDGSDVRRGDSVPNRKALAMNGTTATPLPTRITIHGLAKRTRPGLGVFATGAASTHAAAQVIPSGMEDDVSALSTEDLISEQAADPEFQTVKAASALNGLYDLDDRGVLIRTKRRVRAGRRPEFPTVQGTIPVALPDGRDPPKAHRMFRNMRRSLYWPHMAEDVYETVRQCYACARNRISERRHTTVLQLFPANGPLESVAMDILRPLSRTNHGNRFLLVIADQYKKVTRTVPLRAVTALSVARAFVEKWVYVYGPPVSLLTDNGPPFTAKFFQAACAELGIAKVFTTAYNTQTNGQVERYNLTILAALRAYVAKVHDDWDD
jgi:transposase InsO family protein